MDTSSEPRSVKRALVDSSSAILLHKSSLLEKTVRYYNVIMTESVFDELTRGSHEGSDAIVSYRLQNLITFIPAGKNAGNGMMDQVKLCALGRGERDTIYNYSKGGSDFIILDDGKGAAACKKIGIPYINALLIPRIFRIARIITDEEWRKMSARIIECGRYSRGIIEYAMECPEDRLIQFV